MRIFNVSNLAVRPYHWPSVKYLLLVAILIVPIPIGCVSALQVVQQFSACQNNPALSVGGAGSYDAGSVRDNVIWFARGRIWTLYTAAAFGVPPYDPTVGLASSTDGCNWAKLGQVIVPNLDSAACSGGVFSPAVYYDAPTDVLTVAVSCVPDPAHWYTGPIAIAELQAEKGADWSSPTSYVWQNAGAPVLTSTQSWEGSQGVYAPGILANGPRFYLFYSSSSASGGYQVGIATASSPLGPWTKNDKNPITSGHTNCEEPAPITLANADTYMFCDSVRVGRHGINTFRLIKADLSDEHNWSNPGIYELADRSPWSMGEIGSQSVIQLPDGKILMAYNGKPRGTDSDVRSIGFAFVKIRPGS
jgi:Glycosyl hydrolases family 43